MSESRHIRIRGECSPRCQQCKIERLEERLDTQIQHKLEAIQRVIELEEALKIIAGMATTSTGSWIKDKANAALGQETGEEIELLKKRLDNHEEDVKL